MGQREKLERKVGETPRSGDGGSTQTPEIQDAEGESGVGGDMEAGRAPRVRQEEDCDAADPTYPHLRMRLAAEIQGWVIGAYRGSNMRKVEELTGIAEVERLTQCKRIRWAASVYDDIY